MIFTAERCYITELLNDDASPEVSVALARVEPGTTTQLHALQVAERYVVQVGTGRVELAGSSLTDVCAGDVVLIPPGTPQRIRNTGPEPLEFLCICTPRFRPEHYENLETSTTATLA